MSWRRWRFWSCFGAAFAICLLAACLSAAMTGAANEPVEPNESLTQDLLALSLSYRSTRDPAERQALLDEMILVARERSRSLMETLSEDPSQILRVRWPDHLRTVVPPEVEPFLERDERLQGRLEILLENDGATCKRRFFLQSGNERVELFFAGGPPQLPGGAAVAVQGTSLPGALVVEDAETSVIQMPLTSDEDLAAAAAETSTTTVTPVPYPGDVLGEQRVVVLLANFQDDPDERPWTASDVSQLIFSTVSDYFYEASYGQTWLTGDVFGWFTLSIEKSACDKDSIETELDAAATAAGIDLAAYDRIIYLFSQATGCRYTGLASMGPLPSRAWINGDLSLKTIGHELGHNFLLYHARGVDCTGSVLGDGGDGGGCSWQEYGDGLSIMGNGTGHFNAYQKQRLGWLGAGSSPVVTNAETSGTYLIEPYEWATPGPKALNVLRSVDAETGAKSWYYIEYRQPLGFDEFLFSPGWFPSYEENLTNGVAVHIKTDDPPGSVLLDMTPDSLTDDLRDPALTVGNTYVDAEAGLSIRTDSTNSEGAVVSVLLEEPTCSHISPDLAVSPATSEWVQPGTPVLYEVTVTNRDDSQCGAVVFLLDVGVPEGWAALVVDDDQLFLGPGESATAGVEVTSSESAPDGFYDLTFTATNQAQPSLSAGATATYVVAADVKNTPSKGSKRKGGTDDDGVEKKGGGNGNGRKK